MPEFSAQDLLSGKGLASNSQNNDAASGEMLEKNNPKPDLNNLINGGTESYVE